MQLEFWKLGAGLLALWVLMELINHGGYYLDQRHRERERELDKSKDRK